MREIIVDWDVPSGDGSLSVFHFSDEVAIADQREALDQFLSVVAASQALNCGYEIRTAGKVIEPTNGLLTGFWSDTTSRASSGLNGDPVPDASQALVRWITPAIVNGRLLRGRTYLAGLNVQALDANGNLGGDTRLDIQSAAVALAIGPGGLGVWHRPTENTPGLFELAVNAEVWGEMAVLRSRRG